MFRFALGICSLRLLVSLAFAESQLPAEQLMKHLACASCHPGLPMQSDIREMIPSLSHAGLRYNSAYLFDYLQDPTQVRRHLDAARMPDFHFNQRESLALVLFLEKQLMVEGQWPVYPPETTAPIASSLEQNSFSRVKALIVDSLMCTGCHKLEGAGEDQTIDLATIGYRLNPVWVKQYLAAPFVFDGLTTKMPSFFYQLEDGQAKYTAMLPHAGRAIDEITRYLFALAGEKRAELQRAYENAKLSYPEVTSSQGEVIFLSQNCLACHRHASLRAPQQHNAPDLSFEGARVQKDWLQAYLRKPTPIRPFGFYPGSGSRMPDFRLTEEEAGLISDYLLKQSQRLQSAGQAFKPVRLSAFSMAKAKTLLSEKLPCLGCHQLGNEGGRIGPNLSSLKRRLQGSYVAQLIQDPQRIVQETIMPKILLPEHTQELVVNYLLQQEEPMSESAYLSLVDNPVYFPRQEKDGGSLYGKYCAPCHGLKGDGNGYNARYLSKIPTNHADAAYMARRPDDTLFDGIFSGGYILNKNHRMPPWGNSLTAKEIRQMVSYIRQLCRCEGPLWSRDNK